MNKYLIVLFVCISFFALNEAQTKFRMRQFYETHCEETVCQEKCSTNGYTGGVCKAGDLIMFCICDECSQTDCLNSCQKDHFNGLCNYDNNSKGTCACN